MKAGALRPLPALDQSLTSPIPWWPQPVLTQRLMPFKSVLTLPGRDMRLVCF